MSILVKKIELKGLFGSKNINWDLKDVNVLVGKNGAGKSTILRSLHSILKQEGSEELTRSDEMKVTLNAGGTITHSISKLGQDTDELLIKLIDFSKSMKKGKGIQKEKMELEKLIERIKTKKSEIKEVGFSKIEVSEDIRSKTKIKSELISTVNMSANSVQALIGSDGEVTTILDMEIKNEINELKKKVNDTEIECNELIHRLEKSINDLFKESKKKVNFSSGDLTIERTDKEDELALSNLSSGERQVIYIMLKAANTSMDETVLLMDEPEISLHLTWQEKLINSILYVNEKCQLIIVTHSPAIVMKGWMGAFVDIKNIQEETLSV
ncbi:ATP-binding protein [Enterobacter hormaechei subsp. steigerwaltii]|jgi:ABC-type cobalamin/Fe3+-siderophores transport system ATPase subunit|nr:ATP-binding protein [Enterobacter hormaechei subsp. steigerwaltii]MCU3376113.1 ATP-binding protein [Enterobacter hormaechei subsp. steigerwaltii]